MSAPVLLNLLKQDEERDKIKACQTFYCFILQQVSLIQ